MFRIVACLLSEKAPSRDQSQSTKGVFENPEVDNDDPSFSRDDDGGDGGGSNGRFTRVI